MVSQTHPGWQIYSHRGTVIVMASPWILGSFSTLWDNHSSRRLG